MEASIAAIFLSLAAQSAALSSIAPTGATSLVTALSTNKDAADATREERRFVAYRMEGRRRAAASTAELVGA
jgi:hypothetical protein